MLSCKIFLNSDLTPSKLSEPFNKQRGGTAAENTSITIKIKRPTSEYSGTVPTFANA